MSLSWAIPGARCRLLRRPVYGVELVRAPSGFGCASCTGMFPRRRLLSQFCVLYSFQDCIKGHLAENNRMQQKEETMKFAKFSAAVALSAMVLGALPAVAADITLRFASVANETSSWAPAQETFKREFEARTNGRLGDESAVWRDACSRASESRQRQACRACGRHE